MKLTFHIPHFNQLYEFNVDGLTITLIRHWMEDRRTYRDIGYKALPEEVKNKLITKLRKIKNDNKP